MKGTQIAEEKNESVQLRRTDSWRWMMTAGSALYSICMFFTVTQTLSQWRNHLSNATNHSAVCLCPFLQGHTVRSCLSQLLIGLSFLYSDFSFLSIFIQMFVKDCSIFFFFFCPPRSSNFAKADLFYRNIFVQFSHVHLEEGTWL